VKDRCGDDIRAVPFLAQRTKGIKSKDARLKMSKEGAERINCLYSCIHIVCGSLIPDERARSATSTSCWIPRVMSSSPDRMGEILIYHLPRAFRASLRPEILLRLATSNPWKITLRLVYIYFVFETSPRLASTSSRRL
jgi:hypothetical protein